MIMKANILTQLQGVVTSLNLTPYGISQVIAAETDPSNRERMACEKRWQSWLKGEGLRTLIKLESDLNALGYNLEIKKR